MNQDVDNWLHVYIGTKRGAHTHQDISVINFLAIPYFYIDLDL